MRSALVLALFAVAASASAQQVYRCGNVYQQAPCAGGRAVDASDARSDEDRRAAEAVAKGNAKLAADMERDRRAREAQIRPQGATGIPIRSDSATAPTPAKKARKARAEKELQVLEPRARARKKAMRSTDPSPQPAPEGDGGGRR